MGKNDRGFTLVELIVSCAILGVIALAATGFLVAGTRTYSHVNYSVQMQYESQLAMNQIQNYVINCGKGIAFSDNGDTKTLYIVDEGADDAEGEHDDSVYVYTFDKESGEIRFGSGISAAEPVVAKSTDILTKNATDMSVTFKRGDDLNHASSATVSIDFKLGNRVYQGSQVIALRNQPVCAGNWTDLFGLLK